MHYIYRLDHQSLPLHPIYEQNIKPLLHRTVKKNYNDAFMGMTSQKIACDNL